MHFYIEHNFGHHLKVATPEDGATAKPTKAFIRSGLALLPNNILVLGTFNCAC